MITFFEVINISNNAAPIPWDYRWQEFFNEFQDRPKHHKYREEIAKIAAIDGNALTFLYEDLLSHDQNLAELLREDPQRMLSLGVDGFKRLLQFHNNVLVPQDYFIRVDTKDDKSVLKVAIRDLRSRHIDHLVQVNGILNRCSDVRSKIINAMFICKTCKREFALPQLGSTISYPKFCINKKKCTAKAKDDFRFLMKKSDFIDVQYINIQEIPEDLPPGRIPRMVTGILSYDLVESIKPGDRVKIIGIYKTRLAGRSNELDSFRNFIDVVHIASEDENNENVELSKEDVKKIKILAKKENIHKIIANSIAPAIYARDDLKMASALSLFGAVKKNIFNGTYKRDTIHVLFIGDPGTAKSLLLKSIISIAPRGLYTSGKGSTGVGLTAAVVKDPDTGQHTLEAGSVVLANGGIAAIDEFDKMEKKDRSALHEQMAQATVSIAKAGIVATLKAETSIIAAANPIKGRYEPTLSPSKNINLPPTLLSRFDLIFIVKDIPDKDDDDKMAEFILNAATMTDTENEIIGRDILKKYIKYAKKTCKPKMKKEIRDKIKKFYLTLRSDYNSEDAVVSILPRHLDALIRLSEARAKMALKEYVSEKDVDDITVLFQRYLTDTGYDETTGKIDIDNLMIGKSRSTLNRLDLLISKLREVFEDNKGAAIETTTVKQILEMEESLDKKFIDNALEELRQDGMIYSPKSGFIKLAPDKE